jgi:hypothetical protein
MSDATISALLQGGGGVALAFIVWWELRVHGKHLGRIAELLARLLERDRMRNGSGPVRAPTAPGEVHDE